MILGGSEVDKNKQQQQQNMQDNEKKTQQLIITFKWIKNDANS